MQPMVQMPRDSKRQKTGRRAKSFAAAWLEEHGMIWRDGDAEADFGIDGEIELTGEELTGLVGYPDCPTL